MRLALTSWSVPGKAKKWPPDATTLEVLAGGEARGTTGVTPGGVGGAGQKFRGPPLPTGTVELPAGRPCTAAPQAQGSARHEESALQPRSGDQYRRGPMLPTGLAQAPKGWQLPPRQNFRFPERRGASVRKGRPFPERRKKIPSVLLGFGEKKKEHSPSSACWWVFGRSAVGAARNRKHAREPSPAPRDVASAPQLCLPAEEHPLLRERVRGTRDSSNCQTDRGVQCVRRAATAPCALWPR